MIITIRKKGTYRTIHCIVDIPLSKVTRLSSEAVHRLAKRCCITSIEEFLQYDVKEFPFHIKNPHVLSHIISMHTAMSKKKHIDSDIEALLKHYLYQNIRLTEIERKKILGLFLFAPFLHMEDKGAGKAKLIKMVIPKYDEKVEFAHKSRTKKIHQTTIRALRKKVS